MSAIGRFVANLGFFMGAISITLSVTAFYDIYESIHLTTDYILLIYILIYLLLIPFILLLPLYSSHTAMKRQRDKLLMTMSRKINLLMSKILSLSPMDTRTKKLISQLDQLEQATKRISNLPTWPINFSSLRQYFGLSLTPLLPTFISFVLDVLR